MADAMLFWKRKLQRTRIRKKLKSDNEGKALCCSSERDSKKNEFENRTALYVRAAVYI